MHFGIRKIIDKIKRQFGGMEYTSASKADRLNDDGGSTPSTGTTYEEYYVTHDGRLFIRTVYQGTTWGWNYWYGGRWAMCACGPRSDTVEQVDKETFDTLYFVEKI